MSLVKFDDWLSNHCELLSFGQLVYNWYIRGVCYLLCVLVEISRDSLQECVFDSLYSFRIQAQDVWQDLANSRTPTPAVSLTAVWHRDE